MMSLILSILGLFKIQNPERDHSIGHSWLCAQLLVALTLGNEGWGPLKFFLKKINIYVFLAVLGPHCCAGFSLDVESGGQSLGVVCGLLIAVDSLIAEIPESGIESRHENNSS